MANVLPHVPFNLSEPINGYRVQERIGVGGYGEVWKAEAPGGIAKAIKVVFGYHDDERATRELSSLNRIKEVRHPFLLSLERIELIDGHLIIVTELATSSMKQLFEQYRQSGAVGIPRGELLRHLRDAADALDYIFQEHSLQHLDVKPENLLLVGGRVKVADFGLVKDLQDVNCSNMGGLTPVYAAPELFDGRPNNHSDQYSLAIVYQELLTGVLPFQGRTTAQLASQHMHSPPQLDRLPAADQATIARALSKDPQQRFQSCREMVDRLMESTLSSPSRGNSVPAGAQVPYAALSPNKTEVLPWHGAQAGVPEICRTQPPEPEPTICDLAPFELANLDVQYRPTIFIGVGGLAATTLQSLQRRLADRFGDIREVSALQVIAIDTDARTLKEVTDGDGQSSLSNDAAILLPLRQPADYRRESSSHLQWLSRRWIFNIPRSQQTQGFRPLGRLALVDHMQRVVDRLKRAIAAAVDPQGLAASSLQTGLSFCEGPPRVFIVSSTSGGTGSGMTLDIAYLVRKILRDLKLSDEGVCGLLAHCTGRNAEANDLAVANSYAFLSELNHYSDTHHAYPGDRASGLPAFAAQDAPFGQTYVVHLGEDLEQEDLSAATNKLAQFLYLNTVTSASAFFDKCRASDPPDGPAAGNPPMVRTFGLSELGFSYEDIPTATADELCRSLLARWRGTDCTEPEEHPASLSDPNSMLATPFSVSLSEDQLRAEVAACAEIIDLKTERIVSNLYDKALHEMGSPPDAYLLTVIQELANNHKSRGFASRLPPMGSILDALDTIVSSQGEKDSGRTCLETVLDRHLLELAAAKGATLRQWILGLVASPTHRVKGAQRAAEHVAEHLRVLSRETSDDLQAVRRELHEREFSLRSARGGRSRLSFPGFGSKRKLDVERRLLPYFRLRIKELTLNGVCRLAGLMLTDVALTTDILRNLSADLNRLARGFAPAPPPIAGAPRPPHGSETMRRVISETISQNKAELLADMERQLEHELLDVVSADASGLRPMPAQVFRRTARSVILDALKKTSMQKIADASELNDGEPLFSLSAGLKAAEPRLLACGGARRLLLVAPDGLSAVQLVEQLSNDVSEGPTVVVSSDNEVLLCYEAQQLSLRRVAAAVLDRRFQNAEVASRLHTRIDVPWSSF